MTRALMALTALFVGFGLLTVGNGLLSTLLTLRMGLEAFPLTQAGMVMSSWAIGFLAGPFIVPRWIHRIGHIRFFTAVAALAAAATLAHTLWIAPWAWMALRALTGFALASMTMVIESWLNHRTETTARGKVLATYMIVYFLGFGSGQFLIGTASPAGFELFAAVGILFALALIPIAVTRIGEPERPAPHLPRFHRLWRASPLGTLGAVASGFIGISFAAVGPLFAQAHGFSADNVALFMGSAIFAGLALQWPTGWLADRIDRRHLIAGVALGLAGASVLLILAAEFGATALIGAAALYGGIAYALYPLVVSHANDVASPGQTLEVSAGLVFAAGIGSVFGPLVTTSAMDALGPSGLFVCIAAAGLATGLFAIWRILRGQPVTSEDKGSFVPIAQSTPAVVDLEPRAHPDGVPE